VLSYHKQALFREQEIPGGYEGFRVGKGRNLGIRAGFVGISGYVAAAGMAMPEQVKVAE
jgi:hypothetical protein